MHLIVSLTVFLKAHNTYTSYSTNQTKPWKVLFKRNLEMYYSVILAEVLAEVGNC